MTLQLPPLFSARETRGQAPFAAAIAAARDGCEAGLVCYDPAPDRLRAAIVFAPDVPRDAAAVMLPLCGIGFQNALGALAPPEVAVHLGWDGQIYLNGGKCGSLQMAAAQADADGFVDWLVIGLDIALWPEPGEGGAAPDRTALFAEGCGDIDPAELLAAWVRHTLVWINTWDDGGNAPLHREWAGLAHDTDRDVAYAGQAGHYLGLDENLGLLLRSDDTTHLIPLTALIEDTP